MPEREDLDAFWVLVREALTRRGGGHPSDEDLAAYLRDELPAERLERVERHLCDCSLCAETVARLGGRGGMAHDPTRDLVTAVLCAESSALTEEEIHRVLQDKGRSASVADVRGALSSLLADGLLDSERQARELRYRLAVRPDMPVCEDNDEVPAEEEETEEVEVPWPLTREQAEEE